MFKNTKIRSRRRERYFEFLRCSGGFCVHGHIYCLAGTKSAYALDIRLHHKYLGVPHLMVDGVTSLVGPPMCLDLEEY